MSNPILQPPLPPSRVSSPNHDHPLTALNTLRRAWRDFATPVTVSEEQKTQIVGTLRLVHDHLIALQADHDRQRDNIETLQAQLEELQHEGQGLQANASRLRTDLDRAYTTIDHLQRNSIDLAPGHALPRPRQQNIPDPEKFTGERKDLKPFLSQIRLKLQGNDSMFPNLALRLAYISSLVKGPAYAHIEEHIADGFTRIPDVDSLLSILTIAFGDPDEVGTAEREMKSLRQKGTDFATYFAEFQRLMTILRWDPRAKRAALRDGLSTELKDALVFMEEKEEFGAFAAQLQSMDNRIRSRALEVKGTKARTMTTALAPKSAYPAPTKHDEPSFRPGGMVPMALDSSRKISAEERQRRMQEGLCAYCAGSGHFARECPNKRPRPLRIAETSTIPATPSPTQPAKNEPTRE
jgi:hypothetical protein